MRATPRKSIWTLVLFLLLLAPSAATAQTLPPGCEIVLPASGARWLMCLPPTGWNGQNLVVYAHGYVAPFLPLDFYQLTTADGTFLPVAIQSLGFAFATTTYRQNGLAILEGVDDVRQLVAAFSARHGAPARTHIAGVSEGGLVATLLAERSPEMFTSAFAACAPIGNFRLQINYVGDFRVLFDYFFPGIIRGTPIEIPDEVVVNWETVYKPQIAAALIASPGRALELMRVSKAAYDPSNPLTIVNTTLNLLTSNVVAANDARLKLGGNPYGNRLTWYFGSSNDLRLNLLVRRFSASPTALLALRSYETDGDLSIPLVTLHTTRDELIPFGHELLYLPKVDLFDRGRFLPIPVDRYGHCNFTTNELLGAFGLAASLP
jgi:pimeloyl-ACP methyl ester carboxylesterase